MNKKWQNGLALLASVGLVLFVDLLGRNGPDAWYETLAKPWYMPPHWAYPIIWIPLYGINAFCAWLVWLERNRHKDVFGAVVFYLVQLILNMQFSNIFFKLHRMDIAFYEIVTLVVVVCLCNFMFWRVNRLSGVLYLPYTLFVAYQAVICFAFWQMNS